MSAPHDVPSATQLIEAVREWLENDVMASTSGRLHFQARVAVNCLAIVERELAVSADHAAAHTARLQSFGVADDAELAAGIRAGRFDDQIDDVRDAVRASVIDKLSVANPKWMLTTSE